MSRSLPLLGVAEVARDARLRRAVDDHYLFVWRTLRRLGLYDEADDVAQEVFLVFARKLDTVEPAGERGFLFRAAVFAAKHAQRKYSRQRAVEESVAMFDEGEHPSVEEDAERQETMALLDSLLMKLPENIRAAVILCDLEEMTMNEAAEILAVPVGSIASRLRRGRAALSAGIQRAKRSMR